MVQEFFKQKQTADDISCQIENTAFDLKDNDVHLECSVLWLEYIQNTPDKIQHVG